MESGILVFLQLIGSLALFLYGMKMMSESLQKLAGNKMRDILSSMTSNRFMGLLTGIIITALIQSSSATTVMVVSFVNAGLLDLVGSINVILGANIGTTVTSWIVSVLGFGRFSISDLALPIIGCALPLLFSKKRSRKNWGEMIVGFGLLFLALRFLQECMNVDNLAENSSIQNFITAISSHGILSRLLFVLIGAIVTAIFQSSSAVIALTLVICASGLIGFEEATAMIIGENIGTTITALFAASVANTQAKRAALSHMLINVFGAVWMFIVFPYFLQMVGDLSVFLHLSEYNPLYSDPDLLRTSFSPEEQPVVRAAVLASMPLTLSLFNTLFKTINVVVLIGLVKPMAKIVSYMLPIKGQEDSFTLKHIKIGLLSTPEASLFQAQQEILLYGQDTLRMFQRVESSLDLPAAEFEPEMEKLRKMEDESDLVEVEIANYLTKVTESRMSTESTQRVRAMFKIVSEIESIADTALHIAGTILRRNEQNVTFAPDMTEKLKRMFALAEESVQVMCTNLAGDYKNVMPKKAYEVENAINKYRTELKQEHMVAIEEKKYGYNVGILFNDMVSECEKAGAYAINVTQAMQEVGHEI
ncbi:MAG: Na/Pi cotransporter family protein [Bacteroidales bacterium]|nr:Na/Pi cotransporter family protein [Bacteroidales bacterium]